MSATDAPFIFLNGDPRAPQLGPFAPGSSERRATALNAAQDSHADVKSVLQHLRDDIARASDAGERVFTYAKVNATGAIEHARVHTQAELAAVGDGRLTADKEFARYVATCDPHLHHPMYLLRGDNGAFFAGVLGVEAAMGHARRALHGMAAAAAVLGAPNPADAVDDRLCHNVHCGARDAPLKRCTRCRTVWYCSAACQRLMWPLHKRHCRRTAATAAAAAANAVAANAAATATGAPATSASATSA